MYPFTVNFIVHYLLSISTNECVFYPSWGDSPARIILCQGHEIVSFPPISESVARGLEEIYIVSTFIKCMNSDSEHFGNLTKFGETDNMFWDCDCMDEWFGGLKQSVDINSECPSDIHTIATQSEANKISTSSTTRAETPKSELSSYSMSQSSFSYSTETAESASDYVTTPQSTDDYSSSFTSETASRSKNPQPDEEVTPSVAGDQFPQSRAAAAAAAGGGAALAITAIIIAVRVGCKPPPNPSFDVEADAERFWIRQSNSGSRHCCRCLKPNGRTSIPSIELEDMDMERFSVCESEI